MESDGNHRSGCTSCHLFCCFKSYFSTCSSSMKICSKSILSLGRARDPAISLSNSLSRRLRGSGSIKNGQASPMFPNGGRKRGGGIENPEPSSPKVTCIGQVRVKTKKHGKKIRNLSRRHSHDSNLRQSGVSNQFKRQESFPHRNQRWVHLPLTICEALRAFGAEFSCLFPCRPSCFSKSNREKVREGNGGRKSSCGAVFGRWFVAVEDGEGGKRRELELVLEDEERDGPIRSSRRHVFDGIEIKDEIFGLKDHEGNGEGEEGGVSICIPPKNALLLMRCRSDPIKMEVLANRFWESPQPKNEEDEDNGDDYKKKEVLASSENRELVGGYVGMVQEEDPEVPEKRVSADINEEMKNAKREMEVQEQPKEDLQIYEELQDREQEKEVNQTQANELNVDSALEENHVNQESDRIEENDSTGEKNEEESNKKSTEPEEEEFEVDSKESTAGKETEEKASDLNAGEPVTQEETHKEEEARGEGTEKTQESKKDAVIAIERASVEEEEERESSVLPDCLLLMMCEPKLSMEVSKETWVCSTDFIRWQPEKKKKKPIQVKVKESDGGDKVKKRSSVDSKTSRNSNVAAPPHPPDNQTLQQPRRLSCSAAAVSMATMIEQKLVSPFVLTRCKSEPRRTESKLAPDKPTAARAGLS